MAAWWLLLLPCWWSGCRQDPFLLLGEPRPVLVQGTEPEELLLRCQVETARVGGGFSYRWFLVNHSRGPVRLHRRIWRDSELFFLADEPDLSRPRLPLASTEMRTDLIDPAAFVVLLPGEGFCGEEWSTASAALAPGEHRLTLVMRNQEYREGRVESRCLVAPPLKIVVPP